MSALVDRLELALPLLPTVFVVVAALGAGRLARRLLKPGPQALDRGAFRQQLVQLSIGLFGVVLVGDAFGG